MEIHAVDSYPFSGLLLRYHEADALLLHDAAASHN